MSYPDQHHGAPYTSDPEKGGEPSYGLPEPSNRFIPGFLTIQMPQSAEIDQHALEYRLRSKYILVFFIAVSIILSCVVIGGCSESGSANIYLLQVRYGAYELSELDGEGVVNPAAYATVNSNVKNTDLAVRIGYFGTCIQMKSATNSTIQSWYCDRNVTHLANSLKVPTEDPFNAIYISNELRSNVLSPAVFIMSAAFSFMAMLVLLMASIQNPTFFFNASVINLISSFLLLIAMVWQQVVVNTSRSIINNLSSNAMVTTTGPVTAGLGWTSMALLFGVTIGIVILVINENQALRSLSEFGADVAETQQKYGQNALNGRSTEGLGKTGDYGAPEPYPSKKRRSLDMPSPF